jgi:FtsP/CotA-like multicopper oxidase with cupredoxin domain
VSVLAALTVTVGSTSAATVTVNLRAEAATKTMPDGITMVPMWGFAVDADPVTVPGPPITVTAGDTLTVNLTNNLSVPVSLVIPGQITTMSPVWFTDAQGRQRVMSFTHEAASGGGMAVYTWTNLKPGTYLYQSGTHPAVQIQMGLYGSLIVESTTPGQAYDDASSAYDEQLVLLYSEIDPALHEAIDDGSYGTTGPT